MGLLVIQLAIEQGRSKRIRYFQNGARREVIPHVLGDFFHMLQICFMHAAVKFFPSLVCDFVAQIP